MRLSPRLWCATLSSRNGIKWIQCLDNGGVSGALLTDLSKAFDCILHDLLIAKLAANDFDYNSLQMLQSYRSNRKQRK